MDEALHRLAEAAGIESRYWDIERRLHETAPETTRHLLRTLGFPAGTEAEIAASFFRLEEERWRETTPPVTVSIEGQEITVPLHLPAGVRWLTWSIEFENGGGTGGEVNLDDLAVEASVVLDGASVLLRRLRLPAQSSGYHRLHVQADTSFTTNLVVAPRRCYLPPGHQRHWGVAAQLYAVRSEKNWGMGDFTDLSTLMDWAGAHGASMVGVNPLHALFLDAPQDASPYSPCSRLFLNPLYLDVTKIPDFAESDEARTLASSSADFATVRAGRVSDIVDYPAVTAIKLAVLERLYQNFRMSHSEESDVRRRAFHVFVAKVGSDLHHFAMFQMLTERFGTHDWTAWPQSYQKPGSIQDLPRPDMERITFFQYLQWQCTIQLGAAAARARAKGMSIGLYNDLAVSVDNASADHWVNQGLFLRDTHVGAPPDPFNEKGQDWGLVAFNPRHLRATGYAHFISLLRANMRHAGALRIDHIMGWQRLFLIPAGAQASDGAYVRYPADDLMGIASLESQRAKCLVIGEDLGTVPDGLRERMATADILSSRVLYFERDGDRFRRPSELPVRASVSVATHDLATLRGYWMEEDITVKARLGFLQGDEERQFRDERACDKRLLLQALASECLLPHDYVDSNNSLWTPALADAIHAYLARSPSLLLIVQLEDLANEVRQANLPGSITEYPNWRQRLSRSLEEMANDPVIAQTMTMIGRERNNLPARA
jgi:4-alpha-glucanotransferase